jgi:hypothetical protein
MHQGIAIKTALNNNLNFMGHADTLRHNAQMLNAPDEVESLLTGRFCNINRGAPEKARSGIF